MVEMMKDNVHRIVTPSGVAEYLARGFIVVGGEGDSGNTLPLETTQDEIQSESIEAPVFIDTSEGDALMYGGIHLSQVSTIDGLRGALTQYDIPYSETDSKAALIKKRNDYIDSVRAGNTEKRGRPTNRSKKPTAKKTAKKVVKK